MNEWTTQIDLFLFYQSFFINPLSFITNLAIFYQLPKTIRQTLISQTIAFEFCRFLQILRLFCFFGKSRIVFEGNWIICSFIAYEIAWEKISSYLTLYP